MERRPALERNLATLTAAAADTVATLAVIAQLDAFHARETGDREAELLFTGEMRAYREVGIKLVSICREALEV